MRILIASLLVSFSAIAGQVNERRVCPNLTDDARSLVESMRTLQDQLRKLPECQTVQEKVNVVNSVITKPKWKEIKELFQNNGSPELTGEDIDLMATLVNDASVSVADTVSLLSGQASHCIPKDKKASFLSTLAGVTREISTLAGGLTGPYGQAISIVGGVLTGTISGIDKLFKAGKIYDFHNTDEELLFMNQFCSYAELQQEITDYEKLESRPAELEKLIKSYSEVKINDLSKNCAFCNGYKLAWEASDEAVKIIERIAADARIISANAIESQRVTFSRCMEINRAFRHEASDFNQYIRLLEKYENPMQSESDRLMIQDAVTALKQMKHEYPNLTDCLKDPREVSLKFNDFIRDEIIGFNNTLFQQQMGFFRKMANDKYVDDLGDSIYKALEGKKWAQRENIRVKKKIKEANFKFSLETMIKEKNEIHKRMSEQLMPKYLSFRMKRTMEVSEKFVLDFENFKRKEIPYFNKRLKKKASTLPELLEYLKENKSEARLFASSYVSVFNESRLVTSALENNERYCTYLQFSRTLSAKNRKECSDLMVLESELIEFTLQSEDIEALKAFETWALKNELDLQSSSVMDYAERIRLWLARGDDRWQLTNPEN